MTRPSSPFLGLTILRREDDGYGQSLLADLRSWDRYRTLRKGSIEWAKLLDRDAAAIEADPFIGRFADSVVGVATIDARSAIIMERMWSGWPDPPRYALFVIDAGAIWAAQDFDAWPSRWKLVGADGLEPPTLSV